MANSKDVLFKSKVNNYISERATTTPVFAVTNDGNGNYTVSKFNGDVTLTIVGGNYVFTPTRGDPVSILATSVTSIMVDFITLHANALVLDGETVTGSGVVNLSPFSSMPDVNLAGVQTAVLSANIIGNLSAPTQIYTLNIGAPTVGRIINITSGEVTLDETLTIPQTTSFVVEAGATLTTTQIINVPISGEGTVNTIADINPPALIDPTDFTFTDTGSSAADGVTSNGTITVALAIDTASWQYSTNGGTTWTDGVDTSFTLAEGTYDKQNIQVKQFDATGNSSISAMSTLTTPSMIQLEAIGVTNGSDISPQIVSIGTAGEFAVTFCGIDSDGDYSVFVQKFNADGTITDNAMVQLEALDVTNNTDYDPQIASIGTAGEFVVTFRGIDSNGDYSVFVQKFNADGTTTGNAMVQLEALDVTNGYDYDPQIASIGTAGEFVVTFRGIDSDGDFSVFVQKFNADGTTTNNAMVQLEALDVTNGSDISPQIVSIGTAGEFVVTFQGIDNNGDNSVFVQKFNADGTIAGSMVQLEALNRTDGYDYSPQITALGTSGEFAVTFHGRDSDGDYSVFVQKFNEDGTTTGNAMVQLEALDVTNGSDYNPQIASIGTAGEFAVTFFGMDSNGDNSVFVQKFNADGTIAGSMVQLEASGVTNGDDLLPEITALGTSGEFAVTFYGVDSDGDYSVFVQKFNADGTTTGSMVQLEAPNVTNLSDEYPQITSVGTCGEFIVTFYGEDSDGDYSVFVQRFNADGTIIANPLNTLKIDSTLPTVTIDAATSNGASPVLMGNVETGSAVTLTIAGATYTTTAICGTWSLDTSTATLTSGTLSLANGGVYTLTVNAVDIAGNASTQATDTLGLFTATTDISSDTTTYVNVTNFLITSNQTLTLTAAQAELIPISGAGSVVVTGAVGNNVLYILTSGTNSITAGEGSDTINLGEAVANGGVDTMIIANGDSSVGTPDQIVYFELDKDKLDLPSTTIAGNSTLTVFQDVTVNSITIGQTTITNGIATFQAADDTTSVTITSADALSAAVGYLTGAIADTETVAFIYDLGSGNSGTYLFQGDASGDIVVDLVGVSVTGGDLSQIII